MKSVKTLTGLKITVGSSLSCKYPKNGTRNVLCQRDGKVDNVGVGPAGPFATLQLSGGSFRTLSLSRMIDPAIG
jgi:hypothetical protein